jgi:hypothetical protein
MPVSSSLAAGRCSNATANTCSYARASLTAPSATHWEKYYAIEAAVPDVQAPLRTLTLVYERANYAGKALTDEQRNAALEAFRAIKAHVEGAKESV